MCVCACVRACVCVCVFVYRHACELQCLCVSLGVLFMNPSILPSIHLSPGFKVVLSCCNGDDDREGRVCHRRLMRGARTGTHTHTLSDPGRAPYHLLQNHSGTGLIGSPDTMDLNINSR